MFKCCHRRNQSSSYVYGAKVVDLFPQGWFPRECVQFESEVQRYEVLPVDVADYSAAFQSGYASALTKFDSLDALFTAGLDVPRVADLLTKEVHLDADFAPFLVLPGLEDKLLVDVRQQVGRAFGCFKKCGRSDGPSSNSVALLKSNPLPWSSIEAYPEWVVNRVQLLLDSDNSSHASEREYFEDALLRQPLRAASLKYDGTCFGKLASGELMGRRHMVSAGGTYQNTTTAACEAIVVDAILGALSTRLNRPLGTLCVYGELMCNPGYYSYGKKGLASKWLCFGAVLTLAETVPDDKEDASRTQAELLSLSEVLKANGFAHSLGGDRVRLLLCTALRQLFEEASCDVVEQLPVGLTHADMVAHAAASLISGDHEGIVVVFDRPDGQSSARKWKNSSEGDGVSKKHAERLHKCEIQAKELAGRGLLDGRVGDMLATLCSVAEANTRVEKAGLKAYNLSTSKA